MTEQHGSLSINSENIFPIIKKWMYSDHDIFVRELVSNGCDAITKLRKLDLMGDTQLPDDYAEQILVTYNAKEKTLKFDDNGLGMTAREVEEYINQIAFSGASDFLEKYQGKDDADQIIGHFGLGFYSAFMVADEVHIDTLSWQDGAEAVHWECDGGTEFSMCTGERESVGTTITLFLNEDCLEFANAYRLREVISKYCGFMPVPIYLINAEEANYELVPAEPEESEEPEEEENEEEIPESEEISSDEEASGETDTAEEGTVEEEDESEKPKKIEAVNDIHPLWTKNPSECTEDEYKEFYRNVFHDYKEPLFWIHLNMDYPFRLKGILYFPKINLEYESAEGVIKLYNNQVFIADNIKEVIPEFLMLLKGVIDCPDLPLNVSRSALQNDGFVTKISDYITKKVADKLAGLCKTDKENYEKYWDDISPFIKYGCLKDTKFCDKMNDYILFKDIYGEYQTLPELLSPVEPPEETGGDAEEQSGDAEADEAEVIDDTPDDAEDAENQEPEDKRKTVYYVTNEQQQAQYIRLFKDQDMNAVLLTHQIDTSFISQLEMRNENYRFMRIDSDITDSLTDEGDADALQQAEETLSSLFSDVLGKEHLTVSVKNLKDASVASVLTISEQGQRMADMMKMYQVYGDTSMYPVDEVLTLNAAHPLVRYVLENTKSEHTQDFCRQLYDLAKIANQPLSPDEMTAFVARSNEIMLALTK